MKKLLIVLVVLGTTLTSCSERANREGLSNRHYKAKDVTTNTFLQVYTHDVINYNIGDSVWIDANRMITAVDSNTRKCVIVDSVNNKPLRLATAD